MKSGNTLLSPASILGTPNPSLEFVLLTMNVSTAVFLFLVFLLLYLAAHIVHLIEEHLESRLASSSTNTQTQPYNQSLSDPRFCPEN
jgi:hypothetical protein